MLPKTRRLSRKDFLFVKKQGQYHHTPLFNFIILPNNLGLSRFAVVTSSKLDKLAVVRNELRRKSYNNLKKFEASLDIIMFPHRHTLNLTPDQLQEQIWSTLRQVTNI